MKLPVSQIQPEGTYFEGTCEEDIFNLQDKAVRTAGGTHYAIYAFPTDEGIAVSGKLHSPFELECTRCLTHFPYEVAIEEFNAEAPVTGDHFADLTETLREDILLALPGYPRCEMSTVEGWKCAAEGQFDQAQKGNEDTDDEKPSPWGALDGLGSPPQ